MIGNLREKETIARPGRRAGNLETILLVIATGNLGVIVVARRNETATGSEVNVIVTMWIGNEGHETEIAIGMQSGEPTCAVTDIRKPNNAVEAIEEVVNFGLLSNVMKTPVTTNLVLDLEVRTAHNVVAMGPRLIFDYPLLLTLVVRHRPTGERTARQVLSFGDRLKARLAKDAATILTANKVGVEVLEEIEVGIGDES